MGDRPSLAPIYVNYSVPQKNRKGIKPATNAKEVSVRAGHSSVAFTLDRYGHLFEDREHEIPDRLDAHLARVKSHHPCPILAPVGLSHNRTLLGLPLG